MHEKEVIRVLVASGLNIAEQQRAFEWKEYQITGYIDLKLLLDSEQLEFLKPQRGVVPTEIKSMSPFVFDKVDDIEDMVKGKYPYLRRYPSQLNLYLLMDGKEWGLFLLKNKVTGELKEVWMQLDYDLGESLLKKAEAINTHVANDTLPEPMPYDENTCKDCGYIHICLPDIKRDALQFTVDPDMESKIDHWFELDSARKEYADLDKYIKDSFRDKEKIIVGPYLITGKPIGDNKGWKTKIQRLEGI